MAQTAGSNEASNHLNDILPIASIIIVNYDGADVLSECLKSVLTTDYSNFEIIIVDNNSSDHSVRIIKDHYPSCRVIQLPENRGFAIGNNIGASYARGKYLAFLNNDTTVTSHWLRELILVMEKDPSIAIAQSMLFRSSENEIDSAGDFATQYGRTYNSKRSNSASPREILSARGAAMVVRREAFDTLGGFDKEYFISFEDVELGWKAWIFGYKVVMVPSSIVYHKGASTTSKMSALITFHGLKNQLSLITTHFESKLAIRNIAVVLFSLFVAFMALLFKIGIGKQKFAIDKKAAIRAVFWYIRNLRPIWKKHSRLNATRKRSTRELIALGLITNKIDDQ